MKQILIKPTTDREDYEDWAETHVLQAASFWWRKGTVECECRIVDRTFNDALKIAKEFGFVEPKWYKPWTWDNGVITRD